MSCRKLFINIILICSFISCKEEDVDPGTLELLQVFIGSTELNLSGQLNEAIPVDRNISLVFSKPVNQTSAENAVTLQDDQQETAIDFNFLSDNKNVVVIPVGGLETSKTYTLSISPKLEGSNRESFIPVEINLKTIVGNLEILAVKVFDQEINNLSSVKDIPMDFEIEFNFSHSVDQETFSKAVKLTGPDVPEISVSFSNNDQTAKISANKLLKYLTGYELELSSDIIGTDGESFEGYHLDFYTELDSSLKFPKIPEDELLTKVQSQTFKYFWEFGHPESGMIRERNTSGNTVTSGGTGFGLMAIIVGIERGFITRTAGVERLNTIINFLENADRFHGVWSHWLNGATGEVIPFSANDDGGDLVETSFLVMGLLSTRQYLNEENSEENSIIEKINALCETVEWDWYTQGENSLTWHWSPNVGFQKNLKIRGWNEALITYLLAASSTTHTIDREVYDEGWWGRNIENGKTFYDISLPLGQDYGGPLFFEHYSFLGIDPRNLQDGKVDYWDQVVNHSLINHAYCKANPKDFVGYNGQCWGLTASDGNEGYSAHSPTNDKGVITPTAALSSIAFTPQESKSALNYFYYILGDRLWGEYGFYDAFNPNENWYATSNIAIDQGPIIIMIENYRTGLLWDLFMSSPEIQKGLDKLGFTF